MSNAGVIVDLFFGWGSVLIGYLQKAADWFVTPGIPFVSDVLNFVLFKPFVLLLRSTAGIDLYALGRMSPIEFIIGPGLLFFLSLKLLKFLLSIIRG